jgi:RimJ/RimL family protein N-acetyltransferase
MISHPHMYLLNPQQYYKLLEPVRDVTFNNLFARWVVEGHLSGKVFADNCDSPETFYVVHPYGMSLLFGKTTNADFNEKFRNYALNINGERNKFEWMQAFPDAWNSVLNQLFDGNLIKSSENILSKEEGIIELNTRINFRFNPSLFADKKQILNDPGCRIFKTTGKFFEEMQGTVVPAYFWKDKDQFAEKGIGFSLCYKGKLASTAYAAFVMDRKLELGIETVKEYRGRGFAIHVCTALIDYCIENGYEPVWACKLENTQSFRLAQKLGFEPVAEIPYYRLGI